MELDVTESPSGPLQHANWQAKLAKKRKKRNRAHITKFQASSETTGARECSHTNMLSCKIVLSFLLFAILVFPVRGQLTVRAVHQRLPSIMDTERAANASSLSWTRDKQNEILKRLSSTGLLEALIKHPIQSNLPFPMLPTVARRMPPPYSLNIPQAIASRERRLNQQKLTKSKSTSHHPKSSNPALLNVGSNLFNVEHLVERLEENKKRLASVSKLEPASGKRKSEDQPDEPILPSDLESLRHHGLTLNMLIREEYDLRVKPMLKSLIDQQRIATASSVQSLTSTTIGGTNMSIPNHRIQVSNPTNLLRTTPTPQSLPFDDYGVLSNDRRDVISTTPTPSQLITPSMSDIHNQSVSNENLEDRSDRGSDVEFDDRRLEEDGFGGSRKRVKINGAPRNVKIIPPYQFGLAGGQFESASVVPTGSQAAASSSSPKLVNGYVQQYRYPSTKSASSGDVSNADATTRLGSLVYSDGAQEAERVKNLRQRIQLLDSQKPQRKRIEQGRPPLNRDEDNDEDEEDEDDGGQSEGANSTMGEKMRHNIIPNHVLSTLSPLDKLESKFRKNLTVDTLLGHKDIKFSTDQSIVGSVADWSRPVAGGRFLAGNYATTMSNFPTTSTTTTRSPHTESPVLNAANYFINRPAVTNGQLLPSLKVSDENPIIPQVTTPRYSFQLHEKPKKNATLYSIPNMSISEVINLRPKTREVDSARKGQMASQDHNLIGPLWSPSKIGGQADKNGETQQVHSRKKHSQQPSLSQTNSSYPMLVSVVGTKGMIVSGGNHSRSPYLTPDYASVDTETEPTRTTTVKPPGRIYEASFFGDQQMESGHDLTPRNESGALYTKFQQADVSKVSSSDPLPRNFTGPNDKHDGARFWPPSLRDSGETSRRRTSNSTHKRLPVGGGIEDAELSDYARADEDETDDAPESHSLDPPATEQRPMNRSSASNGPGRRIIKHRVSNGASQQVAVPGVEFIRKFKPYHSKGFNPDSHEQAGSEIQMTEIDKVLQQQKQDKKSSIPPLFKLAPRESSEVLEGGTLSSSSSSSPSPDGSLLLPASDTDASGEKVNETVGKGSESRNELSTAATASTPVTKQQSATKQQGDTRTGAPAAKQSNDRLAFILIGGSCALSVVCLVLAAMSMRCQDMCDDYRSLRNAERAAMKLQKHRLKYTKSHQINRLSSGHGGAASIDDLPDNLSLNHALEAAEMSATRNATNSKYLASSNQHLATQFGKSSANNNNNNNNNMNIWSDCQTVKPASSAGNKSSECRCTNCARWRLCLESSAQLEKPHLAGWQSHPAASHYCLHQSQQHPTRMRPLFGAGSSVGTFYPRPPEADLSAGTGFTEAQLLIDNQLGHSCSLSDALARGGKQSIHNNSSQKACQKQHVCGELAANFLAATCSNSDHNHSVHLCHNNHLNRYNMDTSASDAGKLSPLDESIHHCEGANCHHSTSLSKRIKLMQLRSNLLAGHTSTGWKHSDAHKASKYHQHHHHHHHQVQRHAKHQHQHQSSSDSSSVDQCTCLHDNQPLLAKNHSRQAAHKHLHQQAAKQEARYASHKTKRDKAMLVWSTNRDRLI